MELLAIVAGFGLGATRGGVVAVLGSLVAAAAFYAAGRSIGAQGLTRWISRRSYRSVRQLSVRGSGGIVALHFASVASAGSINLLLGAGRVRFTTYLIGTAVAMAPAMIVLSGFGGLIRRALFDPTLATIAAPIAAAVLLIVAAVSLRALLVFRHFAPAVNRHRDRAEFG
jgi:uncharacterized membrane protein YdjX (TVP38/TMEM64 family)